jgi:hypothetical protein
MDNVTHNDTLVEAFGKRCEDEGIPLSSLDARMQCMPHAVHLSALKVSHTFEQSSIPPIYSSLQLLEAIGALTKEESQKSGPRQTTYQ